MSPAGKFNRKAGEGAQRHAHGAALCYFANAEFRYRLRYRNGTQLTPMGAKRAMVTNPAIADAVMIRPSARPLAGIHVEWSVAKALLAARRA
ncbi:hypothetical protein ABID25_006211 [Mesorhizobium abyssinicae]